MIAEHHLSNPRIEFFNRAAERWNESITPEEAFFLRCAIDTAVTSQDLGKRILDVGCGTGILFPFLEQWDVTAFDVSEQMLRQAKKKQARCIVEYICGSAEALPFSDGYFAKVMMLAVYPHFDNPLQVLKETFRVLKPQGVLAIIHLKNPEAVNAMHRHIGGAIASDRLPEDHQIVCVMEQAGFTIQSLKSHERSAIIGRKI